MHCLFCITDLIYFADYEKHFLLLEYYFFSLKEKSTGNAARKKNEMSHTSLCKTKTLCAGVSLCFCMWYCDCVCVCALVCYASIPSLSWLSGPISPWRPTDWYSRLCCPVTHSVCVCLCAWVCVRLCGCTKGIYPTCQLHTVTHAHTHAYNLGSDKNNYRFVCRCWFKRCNWLWP